MYCPECKCEYVECIYECVDCHVKLVYELPGEPEETYEEMTDIEDNDAEMSYVGMYRDLGSAEIVKDFLADNGIEAIPIVYRFDQVTRLYVPKEDAQKAEELLKEFDSTLAEESNQETPNEMETTDEEPRKSKSWQFLGKVRLLYNRITWILFGIAWIFFGIYLTTYEDKYFHGRALIALGAVIIIYVTLRWSHSNKRNR